jgi:asparagine N-glycosylation enzyme membrane subunit Stt3
VQLQALAVLAGGGVRMRELARRLGLATSTVTVGAQTQWLSAMRCLRIGGWQAASVGVPSSEAPMLVSFVYRLVCRLFALVLLRSQQDASQDLETSRLLAILLGLMSICVAGGLLDGVVWPGSALALFRPQLTLALLAVVLLAFVVGPRLLAVGGVAVAVLGGLLLIPTLRAAEPEPPAGHAL